MQGSLHKIVGGSKGVAAAIPLSAFEYMVVDDRALRLLFDSWLSSLERTGYDETEQKMDPGMGSPDNVSWR